MKLSQFSMLILLTAAIFLVNACSKDGSAGPAGAPGGKGDKGDPGAPGTTGIIYSNWLDVKYEADTVHLAGGRIDTIGYYAVIDAPKLTQEALTSADVRLYINLSDAANPTIALLPYVEESGIVIRFIAYKGKLQLTSNINAGTIIDNRGAKRLQYRYMIAPGGTAARKAGHDINWSDYNVVKAYLGLKD
ncbi:hypothetical protein ECE50_005005 [Chitinophaga sp. Mgbs1]|uniref:Collagen-like protein n=1 Tax=Chitinophaga solisilvae TaxID=1233460 RepID=A0A9Q5D9I2_9BACT|nr:hypothetical protein [Chitinophaga solisilvae]